MNKKRGSGLPLPTLYKLYYCSSVKEGCEIIYSATIEDATRLYKKGSGSPLPT
ncbi:hypothetical protein [Peptacetobacter hiranonis]|uniref:hypothetical protein n=1 Tax=Peptacetobacter hiranonis TaxID=89152 RepID=UPI003D81A280